MPRLAWLAVPFAILNLVAVAAAEPVFVEIAAFKTGVDPLTHQPIVTITVKEKDRDVVARLTTDNVGRMLDIRLDGKLLARPIIREPILSGVFQISGPGLDKIGTAATEHPRLELEIVPN